MYRLPYLCTVSININLLKNIYIYISGMMIAARICDGIARSHCDPLYLLELYTQNFLDMLPI